jgi:hypothetical protein
MLSFSEPLLSVRTDTTLALQKLSCVRRLLFSFFTIRIIIAAQQII